MRVVIAEDTVLLREGMAALFEDAGHAVVGRVGDAEALLDVVSEHGPDLALVDVRMPPTHRFEGLVAAATIRQRYPATGVLVLSQHVETTHTLDLVADEAGFGYLLKDRVLDVDDFLDAAQRVARGGTALDPEIVKELVTSRHRQDPLDVLSEREKEVLGLMAEGLSNAGIGRRLWLRDRTVEAHVRTILTKLDLPLNVDDHRRVLAVVTYLRARQRP